MLDEFGVDDKIIKELEIKQGTLYLCKKCICSNYFHIFYKKFIINPCFLPSENS